MECSSCKKPTTWAFELIEDVNGEGPTKRHLCFPCIQELGNKIMRPINYPQIDAGGAPR